jgi:hypothetical protein
VGQDEGRRDHRRLEDPRGLRPGLRRDRRRALRTRGLRADRQDEHRRVRDGLVDGELGVRPDRETPGTRAACRRLVRRLDGRGRAGLAPWALGSDTGGSIKQPAALCGVVGLRPTYGTVSRYGIVAFASSLDQIGPIAKTVARLRVPLLGHRGPRPRDSTTVDLPAADRDPEREDLKGLRSASRRS